MDKNPFGDIIFEQLSPQWAGATGKKDQWMPDVDFYEIDGHYHVCIDLPGMKKEDIIIDIDGTLLSVSGKREAEAAADQNAEYFLNELPSGYFSRCLQLPGEVQEKNVKANYEGGVLSLILPPKEIKKKKIDIY